MVAADLGMQHQGLALTLTGFPGKVEVIGSTFEDSVFRFSSCDVFSQNHTSQYVPLNFTALLPAPIENNFELINRFETSEFNRV